MRVLVVIVVIALLLAAIGWLQFSSPDGNPTIRIDSDKVRRDTSTAVEESKQAVDRAAENIDASIDRNPVPPIE